MSILTVEDETRVRSFIERGLSEEGFTVRCAGSASEAEAALSAGGVEVVLMDWMLPGKSGEAVLRDWRDRGEMVPVIMVTARGAVGDRIAALNAGADDFIAKPFVFDELLARVRAVLRRVRGRAAPALACEDLLVDPVMRRVTRAGRPIQLTMREFALLRFLMEHGGEPVPRTRIVEAVWEHDFDTFSNVVDVYIHYLRRKIDEPFGRPLIQTVRGIGYAVRSSP